jgi:drug/metabolite transporter (DMT)-like permease
MSIFVFLTVIGAALLHASWNALIKGGADKRVSMGAMVLGHLPIALIAMVFVPLPHVESWPYIIAGIVLHMGYQLFLLQSYKIGDLTQVYPIARGSAPLLVTLFSVFVLGVALTSLQLTAVLFIGLGIVSLGLVRRANGVQNTRATMLALGTGCFIAAYSVFDGLGARLAGNSLSYYSYLTIGNCSLMAVYLYATGPNTLRDIATKGRTAFFIGGSASFLAYALVTWAFTQAPIALVTALREVSIVFALLIGVLFLKERLNVIKVISTMFTLLGVALLRIGKS